MTNLKLKITDHSIEKWQPKYSDESSAILNINGRGFHEYKSTADANKALDRLRNTIVLRTRANAKRGVYFRAEIKKGYFPFDGKHLFYLSVESSSGGSVSFLDLIDLKEETEEQLLERVAKFKTENNLISDTNANPY